MKKISLDISSEEELSETVRSFSVSRFRSKRCFEKCMQWNCNSVGIYFKIISFIWLNPLAPGLPNLTSGKILFRWYKG